MAANVGGLDRIIGQCRRFASPDPAPLLKIWRQIIEADNERGVLAGQDKDGNPLPAVTYRPVGKAQKWGRKQQRGVAARSGFTGPYAAGSDQNLTSAQYRRLGGPPLAPRGKLSRVITRLQTGQGYDSSRGVYYAVGAWADVVSRKGVPFLLAHFTGASTGRFTLKVRDLRGIRPWGQGECLTALESWGAAHAKATFV
jgi:hypothetical protein